MEINLDHSIEYQGKSFNKMFFNFSMLPTLNGNSIEPTLSLIITPFKLGGDGKVEISENQRRIFDFGTAEALAIEELTTDVNKAIKKFLKSQVDK
jgi:hypothetical protein